MLRGMLCDSTLDDLRPLFGDVDATVLVRDRACTRGCNAETELPLAMARASGLRVRPETS